MKKSLSLLFLSSSIFSMQLDIVKKNCLRAKTIQQKVKRQLSQLNEVKEHRQKSKDDIKQCIESSSFFASKGLGKVKLYHNEKGFYVHHNDTMHYVQPCFTDSIVRNVTSQQIKDFQKIAKGYFYINQMGDGQFSVEVKDRIRGGGPALGVAAYWITKSLCYAIGFAAIGGTVVTTGGAAVGLATYGVATAGGVALTTAAVTTTSAATIGTTAGIVAGSAAAGTAIASGAGIVGGAIGVASATGVTVAGMSVGTAAATTTAAAVTATGSVAATIAGIESISMAIGTFFGMMPTP